ncbi:hypothetical protein [Pseudoflavonifractor sp. 524-17]|nr:hypothetical protein [Pseudoflavonifractor sp. 524-17]
MEETKKIVKTTETIREYDYEGNMVKEVVTETWEPPLFPGYGFNGGGRT